MVKLFDARCRGCGNVHIVRVAEMYEEGDVVSQHPHDTGPGACGEVHEHHLLDRLRGLED